MSLSKIAIFSLILAILIFSLLFQHSVNNNLHELNMNSHTQAAHTHACRGKQFVIDLVGGGGARLGNQVPAYMNAVSLIAAACGSDYRHYVNNAHLVSNGKGVFSRDFSTLFNLSQALVLSRKDVNESWISADKNYCSSPDATRVAAAGVAALGANDTVAVMVIPTCLSFCFAVHNTQVFLDNRKDVTERCQQFHNLTTTKNVPLLHQRDFRSELKKDSVYIGTGFQEPTFENQITVLLDSPVPLTALQIIVAGNRGENIVANYTTRLSQVEVMNGASWSAGKSFCSMVLNTARLIGHEQSSFFKLGCVYNLEKPYVDILTVVPKGGNGGNGAQNCDRAAVLPPHRLWEF